MKKLLLEASFSKIYMILMIIITLLILGGYFSYAMFTVTKEKSNAISIVTGNLVYKMTINDEDTNIITIPKGSIMDFKVVLSNPNNILARFNIAYKEKEGVVLGYIETSENIPPIETGINLEKDGAAGSSNIYNLRVRNETSEDIEIELVVKVGLDYNDLTIDEDKRTIGEYEDVLLKDFIMTLRNEDDNRDYNTSSDYGKGQMYTFNHSGTSQQPSSSWTDEERTDYRYIGDNPNNYIEFNNELWRIIGVFTTEKEDGSREQLVKIVKDESIGYLSWDGSANGTIQPNWNQSEVKDMLNNAYLNSSTMTYYNIDYPNTTVTSVNLDFTENGLKNVSDKIETAKFYTASLHNTLADVASVKEYYDSERGTNIPNPAGDSNWIGKVGLIYPSDYLYTLDYNFKKECYDNPSTCTATEPYSWLGKRANTIISLSQGYNIIFVTGHNARSMDLRRSSDVYPTLYLTSDAIIINGNGTSETPYRLLD